MDAEHVQGTLPAIRDRSDRTIGWASTWIDDRKTGEPAGLSIELKPEIQEELGTPGNTLLVDGRYVRSIRRDEIVLDRTAHELAEIQPRQKAALSAPAGG